jgi:hypothetical protein
MADPHEEQLLNELLSEMRAADAHLDASGLESRVMGAWEQCTHVAVRRTQDTTYYAVAAAVLMAVLVSLSHRTQVGPLPSVQSPVRRLASINAPVGFPETLPIAQSPNTHSLITQSPNRLTPNAQRLAPNAQSPIDFVPLMPMSERELAGPFQILRVQMPRASLGALTSPFDYPNEIVEADLLLGEDGMARAIRVSADDSIYPWRSR